VLQILVISHQDRPQLAKIDGFAKFAKMTCDHLKFRLQKHLILIL